MDVPSRKRDRTKENLTKNIKTLMKNSNKLEKYGAEAYLLVHWKGQFWEYNSFVSRPPSMDELVSNTNSEIIKLDSDNIQRKFYPKPIQKTPISFQGGRSEASLPQAPPKEEINMTFIDDNELLEQQEWDVLGPPPSKKKK